MCYSRIPGRSSMCCRPWQRDGGITGCWRCPAAPATQDRRWGCACRSRLCFAWGEGMRREPVRNFPSFSSISHRSLVLTTLPFMWAYLTMWASGHSPGEPARAGALFQRRAPTLAASQQDECRFGSQAGGNPCSLVWLCAPADLEPGFAVIPTSCCRSLISWSQPGKKTKTQSPNCCG